MKTRITLLFLASAVMLCAQITPMTQITGTLTNSDTTTFTGQLSISWPNYQIGSNTHQAGSMQVAVLNGALSLRLQPTDQMTPIGVHYRVVLSADGKPSVIAAWSVPTSASAVDISTIYTPPGSGSGTTPRMDQITNPTAAKTFAMSGFALSYTYGATTGSGNLFTIQDTTGNTGTGYLLAVNAASGSNVKQFGILANGTPVAESTWDGVTYRSTALLGNYQIQSVNGIVSLETSTDHSITASPNGTERAQITQGAGLMAHAFQGEGPAPTASVTGSGCALGIPDGANPAIKLVVAGTGAACVVTLNFNTAEGISSGHGWACAPLVNRTTRIAAYQVSDSTTTATYDTIALNLNDVVQAGPCMGIK